MRADFNFFLTFANETTLHHIYVRWRKVRTFADQNDGVVFIGMTFFEQNYRTLTNALKAAAN